MSCEQTNSRFPLVWTTMVCKLVHYLWVLLQQITQIFFSAQSTETVRAQRQTCALCPERENDM